MSTNSIPTNNSSNNDQNNSVAELDRQTQARLDEIEQEIKATQPLTSQRTPLTRLLAQYDDGTTNAHQETNHFAAGIQYLMSTSVPPYSDMRMVRGDGNCFYRAFLYSLMERACQDLALAQRLGEYLRNDSWNNILKAGYEELMMETFYETMVDLSQQVIQHAQQQQQQQPRDPSTDWLLAELNQENSTSDYCTWYMRVLVAVHLKSDPERFLPYVLASGTACFDMDSFCKMEVEPMNKECEEVQILALAEAMQVQVVIEYLDGHDATGKVVRHTFGPASDAATTTLSFLYRPGHYDILYPKETASAR